MKKLRLDPEKNRVHYLAEVELVRLLYSNARIAVIGSALSSLILFWIMWTEVPLWLSGSWLAILWTFSLFRLSLVQRFRQSSLTADEVFAWGRLFTLEAFFSGVLWGSSALLLFTYGSQDHYQFSVLILAGLSAASVITHAPVRRAYLAYMVPTLLTPILGLLWKHALFDIPVAGLTIIFAVAMYILARHINNVLRIELELRFANEDLAKSLQLSEEQFRSSFESAVTGMALVALDGHWLRVNRSLCEILGYPEEELLKKTFQELTHPDDLEASLDYLQKLLEGTIPYYHLEKRYVHKDGHVVWITVGASLVRNTQNQPLYFVGQLEDITERRKTEEALEKSHAQLTSAQRIARMGSWEWDAARNVIHPSEELCRIMGIGIPVSEDMASDVMLDRIAAEDRKRVRLALNHVVEGRRPSSLEFKFFLPDGSQRIAETYIEPLLDAENSVIGIMGTLQDVTSRRQLEETTKKALAEEERLKAITTLSMTYAHHILNALTPAQGFAELIAKHTDPSDTNHRWAESIVVNAKRAAEIVNQLRKTSGYTIKEVGGIKLMEIPPSDAEKK